MHFRHADTVDILPVDVDGLMHALFIRPKHP
jgi:hypothetical protein